MSNQYLIGIDIGTSGAKCILMDKCGSVLASSTHEYPLYTPRPGWGEQHPLDWWEAVKHGLKDILAKSGVPGDHVMGVSFSGQMHGLVALDKDNHVIRPAFLWCDQRSQPQCDRLIQKAGGLDKMLSYTNNTMLSGYTGGKLIWLREEEPESFEKMRVFLCPKDYIRYLLCGEIAMDVSEASGTGFFNTRDRAWSDELIAVASLPRNIFPPVGESIDLAGCVTREAAELTGLPEGLKVFMGGGDAVIQTTGSGLIKPGKIGVVIGTAGNVSMGLDRFYFNPEGRLQMFCNNAPNMYHAFGCNLTAGGAYRWYRDALCEHDLEAASRTGRNVYEVMGENAVKSPPGSNGVIFVPYLSGERCPYPDPNARGMFYGLTLGTKRCDITRSVMEGVTYAFKQVADIICSFIPGSEVIVSGGGSSSALWRQILADVFGLPVYTLSASSEGGAFGAALAAGVGAGVFRDFDEAVSVLKVETETLPDPRNRAAYRDGFSMYAQMYHAMKPVFDKGAALGM
jgi:xylulokinase